MNPRHTPGPWFIDADSDTGCCDIRNQDELQKHTGGSWGIATVWHQSGGDIDGLQNGANARLIASAPDHALLAAALCAGRARWELFSGAVSAGEICVDGLRYASELDEFGVPQLHEATRAALVKAGA